MVAGGCRKHARAEPVARQTVRLGFATTCGDETIAAQKPGFLLPKPGIVLLLFAILAPSCCAVAVVRIPCELQ